MPKVELPEREGPDPQTTNGLPHQQRSQNADREMYDALAEKMFPLPQAGEYPSKISVPGARALILDDDVEAGPDSAFMIDREFCHLHPPYDASLHMCLPEERAAEVIEAGWGELHPRAQAGLVPATRIMVYGPRNREELEVVYPLILESYLFAGGTL